ncbi:hypothetical protein ACFQ0B_54800 [Nonomuraea thailandensis]
MKVNSRTRWRSSLHARRATPRGESRALGPARSPPPWCSRSRNSSAPRLSRALSTAYPSPFETPNISAGTRATSAEPGSSARVPEGTPRTIGHSAARAMRAGRAIGRRAIERRATGRDVWSGGRESPAGLSPLRPRGWP